MGEHIAAAVLLLKDIEAAQRHVKRAKALIDSALAQQRLLDSDRDAIDRDDSRHVWRDAGDWWICDRCGCRSVLIVPMPDTAGCRGDRQAMGSR